MRFHVNNLYCHPAKILFKLIKKVFTTSHQFEVTYISLKIGYKQPHHRCRNQDQCETAIFQDVALISG